MSFEKSAPCLRSLKPTHLLDFSKPSVKPNAGPSVRLPAGPSVKPHPGPSVRLPAGPSVRPHIGPSVKK